MYLLKVSLQRQILSDGKRPYGRSLIVIGPFHKAVARGRDGLYCHHITVMQPCCSPGNSTAAAWVGVSLNRVGLVT